MSIGAEYMELMRQRQEEEKKKKEKEKAAAYEQSSAVGEEYMRLQREKEQRMTMAPSLGDMKPGARAVFDMSSDPYGRKETYKAWRNSLRSPQEIQADIDKIGDDIRISTSVYRQQLEKELAVSLNAEYEHDYAAGRFDLDGLYGEMNDTSARIAELEKLIQQEESALATFAGAKSKISVTPEMLKNEKEMQARVAQNKAELAKLKNTLSSAKNQYNYFLGRVFYDEENDADSARLIEEGKKKHGEAWEGYESYLDGMRGYKTTIALTPEGELSRALAPFRTEARNQYPLAVMVEGLSEEDRNTFYYLVGKGQENLALQFANERSYADRMEQNEKIRQWAGKNFGTGLLATAGSALLLPYAWADPLLDESVKSSTGLAYAGGGFGAIKDNLRAGVSESLNDWSGTIPDKVPVLGGKGVGDLYQLGMSIADSQLSGALMGPGMASVLLGSNAFSSAYNQAIDKGASTETAMLQGAAQGLAEMVFEYISLDKLFNGDATKGFFKTLFAQGGIEASEEACTSIANFFTDRWIMGGLSDYELSVQEYMKQGLSEEEARKKAKWDFVENTAADAFGGFISGGGSAAIHTGISNLQVSKKYGANERALVAKALEIDPNNAFAQQMQKQIENGKKLSGNQLRQIAGMLDQESLAAIVMEESGSDNDVGSADSTRSERADVGTEHREEVIYEEPNWERYEEEHSGDRYQYDPSQEQLPQVDDMQGWREDTYEKAQVYTDQELTQAIEKERAVRDDDSKDNKSRAIAQHHLDALELVQEQRNEQTKNAALTEQQLGGTDYENTEGIDDGSQRYEGVGARGSVGGLEDSTGRSVPRGQGKTEAAVLKDLRENATDQSSRGIGIINGSEEASLRVIPEERIAESARWSALKAEAESNGHRLVLVVGTMETVDPVTKKRYAHEGIRQVDARGNVTYYIRADKLTRSAEQIYRHEDFHDIVASDHAVLEELVRALEERYGKQELMAMINSYVEAFEGVYGILEDGMTAEAEDSLVMMYAEEIFGDAYGEIYRGRRNIDSARAILRDQTDQVQRVAQNRNAIERETAPPGDRHQGAIAAYEAVPETVSEENRWDIAEDVDRYEIVSESIAETGETTEVEAETAEEAKEGDAGRIQTAERGRETEEAELQEAGESASAEEAPLEPVPSAEELAAVRERERALQEKQERLAELEGQFNEANSQYGALGKKNKAIDAELRKLYPYASSETRTDILSIDKDFYEEVLEYRQGTNKKLPAVDTARELYEYGYNTLSGVPRPLAPALFQLSRFPERYGAIPATDSLWSVYNGTRHHPKYMIPLGGGKYIAFSKTAGRDGSLSSNNNTNPCIVDENGNPLSERVIHKDLAWDRWFTYEDIAGNTESVLGVSKEELLSSPVIKKAISDLKKQREMDSAADYATYDAPNGGRDVLPFLDRYSENVRQMQELKQRGNELSRKYKDLKAEIQREEQVQTVAQNYRAAEQKMASPGQRFSIEKVVEGENGVYENCVVLDTDLFNHVNPRMWGTVLGKFVYNNLAGRQLTMFDENGNAETVEVARENDRVKKSGAKNGHKVIDKIARYRGDNIKALATVHLSELLTVSDRENRSDEKNHQWLDENGWIYRHVFVVNRNGVIYDALLNIADGRDRRIIYEINNIRAIDKRKETAHGVVPSTEIGRGSHIKGSSSKKNIQQKGESVKQNFSVDDEAYMEAVESGDMETAQRMVDEAARGAGYMIRAYHGTPNGSFNKFRPWQYFTESKEYADIYQGQGASSISYKKTANNPRTYGVFLRTDQPFDTRNAKEKGIFYSDFYRQWGNGAPLSERGLPDWTDGEDLVEFFDENDYPYDAIYLDEGGTGGYGDEVRDRGISIMIKSSEQIKSADPVTYDDNGNVIPLSERFKVQNPDIRYSVDDEVAEPDRNNGESVVSDGFSGELRKWVQETKAEERITSGGWFRTGTVSSPLRSVGVKDTSIYWRKHKIGYIMLEHPEMDVDTLAKVPELLEAPIVVAKSLTWEDSIVVLGDLTATNGEKVMVALNLAPIAAGGMEAEFTLISSAYSRTKNNISNLLKNSEILYLDPNKKRTETWLMSLGLQLPSDQPAFGSVGSITYGPDKVNIQGIKIPFIKLQNTGEETQSFSVDDEVAELDQGYERRMAEDDAPEGMPSEREVLDRYNDLAREQKEKNAREAPIHTLKNRIRSAEKAIALQNELKKELKRIGGLTEESKNSIESRIKAIRETMQIDKAALAEKERARTKEEKKKAKEKKEQEIATQKARTAQKELRQDLLNLFSAREGTRSALSDLIDKMSDKMIQQGYLSHEDRKNLFDALMDHGEKLSNPDEYFRNVRGFMTQGRIYVSESVRAEFGDDWRAFQQRAWGNRIYLTSDENDVGIDVWTECLKTEFGGQFDGENDLKTQLEMIIDLAEEGKPEKLTIAEMMQREMDEFGWSVEEQVEELEGKVDRLLEIFAQKADLEIRLRQQSLRQRMKDYDLYRTMQEQKRDRAMENQARQNVMKAVQKLNKMRKRASPDQKAAIDEALKGIDVVARSISARGLEDLQELARMYNEQREAQGANFLSSPYVEARLARLGQKQIDDMDIEEVVELGRMVCSITNAIQNSNKLLASARKEDVYSAARKVEEEIRTSGGSKDGILRKIAINHLDGKRFFGQISGWVRGMTEQLGEALSTGQERQMRYQMNAMRIFDNFLSKKENQKWLQTATGKNAQWVKVSVPNGFKIQKDSFLVETSEIEITPMMRISLLLHSKNEDNLRHIMTGGIRIPAKDLYMKGNLKRAYDKGVLVKMEPATVRAIVRNCTEQEKAFARLCESYFNGMAKDCINEVSMVLDGFERAGGEHYYHIKTDPAFLAKQNDAVKRDLSVAATASVVNERVHASNPIVLQDVTDALMEHIESISKYYGYAIPIRDVNAVFGQTFHQKDNAFSGSVLDTLKSKWGSSAEAYIDKLLADLQLPESNKDYLSDFMVKLRGNYAKAVISANLSSLLKQTTSYPVALPYLKMDGLLHGLRFKGVAQDVKTLERYSAVYWYRNQGNATTELNDVMKQREFGDTLPWLFNATQKMDSWTTRRILAACEYRIQKDMGLSPGTQAEIDAGTDRYWREVAKLFNDVVLRTQSNSSMMERPQITRANSGNISRFLTMFRTDAYQQYNMLVEAAGRMGAAKNLFDKNGSAENKKNLKDAQKFAARTVVGTLVGQMGCALVGVLLKWMRLDDEEFRDENGEWDWGTVAGHVGLGVVEGYCGFLTAGEWVYSAIEAAIDKDKKWWDLEVNSLSVIDDVISTGISFFRAVTSADFREARGAAKDTALALSKMAGIPAENLEKYLYMCVRWIAPEFVAKRENWWDEITKSDLSKESVKTIDEAISVLLDNRTDGLSDEDKGEIARLYMEGGIGAVPSGIPSSVSYTNENGEKIEVELTVSQQKEYRELWSRIVSDGIGDVLTADAYEKADDEGKTELITKLYSYANAMVAHELVPDKEVDKWVLQGERARENGIPLGEYIAFRVGLSDVSGKDDSGETVNGLKAQRSMDLIEDMGWTDKQEESIWMDVVASESAGKKTDALMKAGLTWDQVNDIVVMGGNKLETMAAIVKTGQRDSVVVNAMCVYASDKEKKLLTVGLKYGIKPEWYIDVLQNANTDGKGSVSQAEAREYILGMDLSLQDKAALFQMITDAKEGKSNPFYPSYGEEFWYEVHEDDPE